MGNYSAADTVSGLMTANLVFTTAQPYQRLRDQASTLTFSLSSLDGDAYKEANASGSLWVLTDVNAIPTFVRNLTGEAVLEVTVDLSAFGNYTTDAAAVLNVAMDIEMTPFLGKFWNPESPEGNWNPEEIVTDIWVPETNHPSPWG
jgi:hypothetical protein